MSAAVVTRRGRTPRARHDAGIEPLDWTRVVLVLALIGLTSGAGLAAAGMLRQGPLEALGYVERDRAAVAVTPAGSEVQVFVRLPDSACPERLTVRVLRETAAVVELGPVRSREPRFSMPPCAAPERPAGYRPVALARLSEPLRQRRLLVDGRELAPALTGAP